MQNVSVRYGDMFSCGCDPPTEAIVPGVMGCAGLGDAYALRLTFASSSSCGMFVVAALCVPDATCECVGSSFTVTVWLLSPPRWPSVMLALPQCIGTRPRRSGSANVVWPLPPYVVPSSENSAWFWLMGINAPLHIAQPRG